MRNAFFTKLLQAAKRNKRIIFISVDQPTGFDDQLKENLGKRFIVEPISEANIIGMASGLAANNFIPIIFNHATFNTRRCYEQILLDSSLQQKKIILVSMGAGLATSHLGPTHTSSDDIALMRLVPRMSILNPCNALEVSKMFSHLINYDSSSYLRLSKYGVPKYGFQIDSNHFRNYSVNKPIQLISSKIKNKILFVSTGILSPIALEAITSLDPEKKYINLFHAPSIDSLKDEHFISMIDSASHIFIAEEHKTHGGFSSALTDFLIDKNHNLSLSKITKLGLPNHHFIHNYGDQYSVLKTLGLDSIGMQKAILKATNFDF